MNIIRENIMRNSYLNKLLTIVLLLIIAALPAYSKDAEEKRSEIQAMKTETLNELYSKEPGARKHVQNAKGYAVFSNFGMKIFLAGGGKGSGVAINNSTKKNTYMKMVELQAGLGIGIKKFRQVWVFENISDFNHFINSGWELGGQGTAAAKLDDDGGSFQGAISVKPGIWLYQMTEDGLALELTGKGTKYYQDKDLN